MQEKTFPKVTEEKVSWGGANPTEGYKAIVNPDTGKVFSIVSKYYRLIRHEEAIAHMEKLLDAQSPFSEYKTKTKFYNQGGRMLRVYRFKGLVETILPKDDVRLELHLTNSYDTAWSFSIILAGYRLVCSNGLVIMKKYSQLQKRHVYDTKDLLITLNVSNTLQNFYRQADIWRQWTERPLTARLYNNVMQIMDFGLEATEEIHNTVYEEAEDLQRDYFPIISLWIFYNILTRHITHRAVSLNHRVELERRLRKSMKYF